MMKYRLSILSFLFLAFLVPGVASPSRAGVKPVGTVTEVTGTAALTRSDGQESEAKKGLALFPGDMITTGEDGVVSFVFNGGDSFRLNEDSHVALDELSSSEEDTPPVLRLSLGFLWSRIKVFVRENTRQVIYTPNAVLGVRGTEFDTVVSEDSSSVITVDAGSVEVETEEARLMVEQGQSTEVDPDEKILPPSGAVPRDQRDWRKFRRERAEKLIRGLPHKAPRIRKRFERDVDRYLRFTDRIHSSADRISSHLTRFYDASEKKDRKATRRQLKKIKSEEQKFRPMVIQFRKAFNRVKAIGKNAFHVKQVFLKNRDRYSSTELAVIEPNLVAVAEKLGELRKTSDRTIAEIRRTYRNLNELRGLMEKRRSGRGGR